MVKNKKSEAKSGKTKVPKIGKPQRSKKHKKIKAVDPFYVGPRKVDNRDAGKFNLDPKKGSDDYLPAGVMEMNRRRRQAEGGTRRKNKFKKGEIPEYHQDPLILKKERGMTRPLKPVPTFSQRPGESETAFMYRMDRETQQVLKQAEFEDKYQVDVEQTESGEVKITKQKDVLEPLKKEKVEQKKPKKKNQRKAEKVKEDKIERLQEKIDNFEEFTDEVKFGEVAMAPPSLTAKPRKVDAKSNRPGTKSLLLTDMMSKKSPQKSKSSKGQGGVGKSLKRKKMSLAQQRILDSERERAIEMYRKIKKQKMAAS